ncbi:hypothetical protein LO763_07895 [Glycomyces sp. A-F 0318]|uniref:hypothetical protein n=1 Tax=Glycomyces amatae TaxID=2881355 RepID=UPI001E651FA4|nr:hypothetical protein [Glycomyces amatae]MCD0443549.1 hypothetical protein [Glycomyces amatae]
MTASPEPPSTPDGGPAPSSRPFAAPAPPPGGGQAALGWGLLAVAFIALLFAYVLPTVRTAAASTSSATFLSAGEFVGGENYANLLGDRAFTEGFAAAALLALGWAVGGGAVAFLVAWCVHLAGRGVRLAARITAVLAAVAFAPAAWSIASQAAHMESWSTGGAASQPSWSAWTAIASGTVFGIGLLVGLAAFRGGAETGRRARTVLAAAGLTALALLAAGLQSFAYGVATAVQPASPNTHLYRIAFLMADSGTAAAASVMLLAPLALLGIGAGLVVALARVRIDVPLGASRSGPLQADLRSGSREPHGFRPGPGVGAIALLGLFAAGALINLEPWLSRVADGPGASSGAVAAVANTWGSALVTTAVALASAFAGAFAIGVVRPLGDRSLWLLLPFSPWLFVGTGPLVLEHYEALIEAEGHGTFLGMAPRAWIAVPALFLLTALLWGVESRRREAVASGLSPEAARGAAVRAAWPLAALIGLGVLIANAQDTYWQLVTGTPDRASAWSAMAAPLTQYGADAQVDVGIGYPLWLLVPFAAAAVCAAVWSLPKAGIRTGR